MRMEFPTLEELEDFGATFLYYTDVGVIGELIEEETKVFSESKPVVSHYVYTETATGKLYVASKGTTYSQSNAKTFTLEKAKEKAYFMSKKGNHEWRVL